ncbi:hypothetical protein D9758_003095 [Tetrapyrgos nigripes]|uniref:MYND-type domain-containing protein n=1 Tax=Tetrapyrgos nigripes TaxID=182062 RepID=A0A8H5GQ66_9AGAR|nr:hypothetical protein D9758_003095 [Tetrapyrgos nigripes]
MPQKFSSSQKSSRPSYKENRAAWNQAWEREQDALYGTDITFSLKPGRPVMKLLDDIPEAMIGIAMHDSLLQNLHVIQSQICTLQRDLSRKAAERCAQDDFEYHWTQKCTAKEREKWILEGLVRTCEASPDLEGYRRYCPEVTIARLNRQSGKGFLDLLGKLVLQDIEKVPDKARTVPNPIWDAMNSVKDNSPGRRVMQRMNDVQRTAFLTYFVWNTLLAFYSESEEYGLIKTSTTGGSQVFKETVQQDERFSKIYNQVRKETKVNSQNAHRGCNTCGLSAERAGVPRLSACTKCKAMGRDVFYCSKACQVKDWKTGHPPHKTICGNTFALADAVIGSNSTIPDEKGKSKLNAKEDDGKRRWNEPEDGYIRSPALLHQLKLLDENHNVDYILVRPYPQHDRGIIIPDPIGKIFFMVMLQRVVCRFAPQEVCRMYNMLLPSASKAPGIGEEGLKKQLKREYGVDIDEWQPIFAKHAEEKLKKEGKTKEQSHAEIEEMYSKLMASMKETALDDAPTTASG